MSCKFVNSPYTANTPSLKLTKQNLGLIRDAESSSPDTFKIALISDTHNYYEDLNQLIKAINKNGDYAFVIINGDVTNYGMLDEFEESRRFFNKLNFPYIVTIGNHDLLANGDKIYAKTFGRQNFSFFYKNIQLVFFNDNNWESGGAVPDSEWIEDQLSSSTAQYKILLGHVPLDDKDRFTTAQIAAFSTLVSAQNVAYLFSGHNHNPQDATFGGVPHITIGSPAKGGYVELQVTPSSITHVRKTF